VRFAAPSAPATRPWCDGWKKKAQALPPLHETLLPAQKGDKLECDELWSYVGSKLQGGCWLWIALCRRTRQVVAYMLGDRSEESARWLRECLPKEYACRATRSDQWAPYAAAFSKHTHRLCTKKEGETTHAERFFCTARQRVARLVRRALSFSKSFDRHELWLRVFLTEYNLGLHPVATFR
jgi:IS1 family transposase